MHHTFSIIRFAREVEANREGQTHGSWVKADWARKHQRARRNSAFAQPGGLWGLAEYLAERKRMMQHWADYLDSIEAGAKVIPLHGNAA